MPKKLTLISLIVHFCFMLIVNSCASKGPVSGGPVDDIPPRIIDVDPEPRSLNVSRDLTVLLTFNENMNRGGVVTSVFIYHTPREDPMFVLNGSKKP